MATALLISHDDVLLDDLLRLAAAAGCALEVAHDSAGGLRGWAAASVVLVGADEVRQVADRRPPRRDQVHVVGRGPAAEEVFRCALRAGAVDVVELPAGDDWLVELLTDAADGSAARGRAARTVGVVPGSGGAGASTFAAALALTAAAQAPAVLIDLDPLGPGADRIVGLDPGPGVRWDALAGSQGRLGSRSLREALPVRDGLAVLTWGSGPPVELDGGTVREVVAAAQRGHEVVVVDLPRWFDAATADVVTRCDRVLVVAEPSIPGVASAARVLTVLRRLTDGVGLVVRGSTVAVPAAQVAVALGVPLVAEVPRQRRLAEHVDVGLGPVHGGRGGLARTARATWAELGVRLARGPRP